MSKFAKNFLKKMPGIWKINKEFKNPEGTLSKCEGCAKITRVSDFSILYQEYEYIKHFAKHCGNFYFLTGSFLYTLEEYEMISKKWVLEKPSEVNYRHLYNLKFLSSSYAYSDGINPYTDNGLKVFNSENFFYNNTLLTHHYVDDETVNEIIYHHEKALGENSEFEIQPMDSLFSDIIPER